MDNKEKPVYLIEHKETHLWWFADNDYSRPKFISTFNGSRLRVPGYEIKDGWTNNPNDRRLIKHESTEDAQKYIDYYFYVKEPAENLIITEHLYINTKQETDRIEFAKLKYQIGQLLAEKFLEYNEGKFHTALELNPATHAITEFVYKHASQQTEALQAEIERLKKRLDKDINALLHLGMVKDEQIERLKNIIKDGKLGN
jgi:hypothetical protein